MKKPHLEVNYQLQKELMYREEQKTRFTKPWSSFDIQGQWENKIGEVTDHQKEKTMGELELALKKTKKRKSPGTGNLHVGLLKFEGTSLKNKSSLSFNNLCSKHNFLKTGKQKYYSAFTMARIQT